MSTILNPKYLSMPEQVQKNKNDIEIINQYLQNVYKTSSTLTEDTTSINIEDTDIDINNLKFALLIDRQGHIYKIVDVIGEVVYLSFLTNIPGGTEYNFTGEWVSGNNEYYKNDLVLYNGNLYLCEANVVNSSTPPNEDIQHWSLFVGYGNDISEFVKSEYDKQLNLITGDFLEYGTYRVYIGYTNKLKPNTTYTISTTNNKLQNNGYNIYIYRNSDKTQIQQISTDFSKGLTKSTFTTSNDIVEGETYYLQFNGTYEGLIVSNPCLVEGTTSMSLPYYGSIVHEKDITPVLLWKNGSVTSEFVGQNITLSKRPRDIQILIKYSDGYANGGSKYSIYRYGDGQAVRLETIAGTTSSVLLTRKFTFQSDTIVFDDCYNNGTVNNYYLIPEEIYELDLHI